VRVIAKRNQYCAGTGPLRWDQPQQDNDKKKCRHFLRTQARGTFSKERGIGSLTANKKKKNKPSSPVVFPKKGKWLPLLGLKGSTRKNIQDRGKALYKVQAYRHGMFPKKGGHREGEEEDCRKYVRGSREGVFPNTRDRRLTPPGLFQTLKKKELKAAK